MHGGALLAVGAKRRAEEPPEAEAPLDAPPMLRPGSLAYAIVHDASLRVIYITPEELTTKEGARWSAGSAALQWALVQCSRLIRAWVFDEVHLVDEWGSTFRAAYNHVREACASVDARRAATQPARPVHHGMLVSLRRAGASRRDFETCTKGSEANVSTVHCRKKTVELEKTRCQH